MNSTELCDVLQRMKLSSEDKVRQMGIPALFISGRSDELIPPRHMDKLHHVSNSGVVSLRMILGTSGFNGKSTVSGSGALKCLQDTSIRLTTTATGWGAVFSQACGSPVKWKVDIPGGDHNSTWLYGGTAYTENLQKFIKTAVSLSTGDLNGDAVASSIKEKLPVSSGLFACSRRVCISLTGQGPALQHVWCPAVHYPPRHLRHAKAGMRIVIDRIGWISPVGAS